MAEHGNCIKAIKTVSSLTQPLVWIFVKEYEHIIETRLDREDREGYRAETTEPRMYSR